MDVEYKGYKATITVDMIDYSDIIFGTQHVISIKINAPHLRLTQGSLSDEETETLEVIAQNLLVRAVESKFPKKRRAKTK